ncbi:hypothetical protein ES703_11020 [subsurface metagenome]
MKQKKNQNKNEIEKKVWINFQATETFKRNLTEYKEKLNIKQSDFIRQAIREKIERIDNPNSSANIDYEIIETIIEKKLGDKQIDEKLNILLKQREDLPKILKELRRTIFELTTIQESQIKTNIIVDYIKKGAKSIKEIMDYAGYDKKTILSLIHNLEENEIVKYNIINGRVEYIE